jgi:hypothetical protein
MKVTGNPVAKRQYLRYTVAKQQGEEPVHIALLSRRI